MSFPRAKIQRFNDTTSCAPPPGAYDPKIDKKVKGAAIQKGERFGDGKTSCSVTGESPASTSLSSCSSKSASCSYLPVFRTPQVPRKFLKQTTGSAPQVKTKLKLDTTPKKEEALEVTPELYQSLLVETQNKDQTIHENEVHIEELRERIRKLEEEALHTQTVLVFGLQEELEKVRKQNNVLQERQDKLDCMEEQLENLIHQHSLMIEEVNKYKLLLEQQTLEIQEKTAQIFQLKEQLEESQSRHKDDVQELDAMCKKLLDEAAEKSKMLEIGDQLEQQLLQLKETIAEMENKLGQKQQMILMLQSDLSSAGVEMEECRAENERLATKHMTEKEELMRSHSAEMVVMRGLIKQLEKVLADEREQQSLLQDNLMNSSVVRENLETIVSEKQSKIAVLGDQYSTLQAEYERSCMEQRLMLETHRLEMEESSQKHAEELEDIKSKLLEMESTTCDMLKVIQTLKDELKVLGESEQAHLSKVKVSLQEEVNMVQKKVVSVLENCEKEVESKAKEMEGEMQKFVDKNTQLEEKLRSITIHRDELRVTNMESQLTIVELQDKVDTLVTELSAIRSIYEKEVNQLKAENIASKEQCKKLKIGIDNIRASLEALRKRLLESENDVEELTVKNKALDSEKTALQETINTLKKDLEENKRSMVELEADMVQRIDKIQAELLKKLEDFKAKAEKNIAEKEQQVLEQQKKMEEMSNKLLELNETLSTLEETNGEHLRDIEALNEKLDHQRGCAQIANQQIASLEASNAIFQHQLQALNAELEYHKNFSQKASDHIRSLMATKSGHEKQISELLTELNACSECVKKANDEIDKLNNQVRDKKSEIAVALDRVAQLEENIIKKEDEMKQILVQLDIDKECKENYMCQVQELNGLVSKKQEDADDANNKLNTLDKECKEKDDAIVSLSSEVSTLQMSLQCALRDIESLKHEAEQREKHHLKELQTTRENLDLDLHELTRSSEQQNQELQNKLHEQEENIKRLLKDAEAKAALAESWELQCKNLESLIGPFREQLEAFESEREALESRKEAVEGEVKELGLRYAEVLGHQNHKQKIRHVMKIKEENFELKKEVDKLQQQVRAQKRTIDKLKEEQQHNALSITRKSAMVLQQKNRTVPAKGKENAECISTKPKVVREKPQALH